MYVIIFLHDIFLSESNWNFWHDRPVRYLLCHVPYVFYVIYITELLLTRDE